MISGDQLSLRSWGHWLSLGNKVTNRRNRQICCCCCQGFGICFRCLSHFSFLFLPLSYSNSLQANWQKLYFQKFFPSTWRWSSSAFQRKSDLTVFYAIDKWGIYRCHVRQYSCPKLTGFVLIVDAVMGNWAAGRWKNRLIGLLKAKISHGANFSKKRNPFFLSYITRNQVICNRPLVPMASRLWDIQNRRIRLLI